MGLTGVCDKQHVPQLALSPSQSHQKCNTVFDQGGSAPGKADKKNRTLSLSRVFEQKRLCVIIVLKHETGLRESR